MRNCILILLCFSNPLSFSQVSFSSSSSNTYYKQIEGQRVSFTIVKSNDNGQESQRCILNNYIDIDCEVVSNCFNKNECDEVKRILKEEERMNRKITILRILTNQKFSSS